MGNNFHQLSHEEAEQIEAAIRGSRKTGAGLAIDRDTGQCVGVELVQNASPEKVNMVSRFDTHYVG